MQRAAGLPLDYPGGAPLHLGEAVDADLLARALHWAAAPAACRNETFNITNGDVFTMRNVWPAIADAFGMEVGDDEPMSLAGEMPARQAEWAGGGRSASVCGPRSSLGAFVGQSFIYADLIMGYGAEQPPTAALVSTIKIRQAGFADCMDTEDMFRRLFRRFQELHWLPPAPEHLPLRRSRPASRASRPRRAAAAAAR